MDALRHGTLLRRLSRLALLILFGLLPLPIHGAGVSKDVQDYERMPSRMGDRCLVCDKKIDDQGLSILYRGRRVPVADEEMLNTFMEQPDDYFFKLQPRGALFQEDSVLGSGIRVGWLVFGIWVLSSLATGAITSTLALQKGLPAVRWYFTGLIANFLGIVLVLCARPLRTVDLPPGLTKIPTTASPVRCSSCGGENHPSASACALCGARLTPDSTSDVDRLPST